MPSEDKVSIGIKHSLIGWKSFAYAYAYTYVNHVSSGQRYKHRQKADAYVAAVPTSAYAFYIYACAYACVASEDLA